MVRAVLVLGMLAACGDSGQQAPIDGDVAEDVAPGTTDASTDDAGITFAATPAAATFTALVNTTARATVIFTNTGGSASAPITLMLGGANASVFMVESSTCTGTLGAGATCTVGVAFTPNAVGTFTADLTLADGRSTAVATLTGSGTTVATGITVSPGFRDFGTVPLGSTSSYFSFTATNLGGAPTAAVAMVFDTGATGDYMLASNLCSGAILPSQGTCTFSIGFTPIAGGTRTASLKITDPGSGAQVDVAVTGVAATGTGSISLAPSTYDFGTVNVGDSAFARQFTLTNNGGSTTGTIGTATGGPNVGDFLKMADNCNGQTLAPGAACSLFVAFEPGAAGPRTAHITAVATPGGTANSDLSGTGH